MYNFFTTAGQLYNIAHSLIKVPLQLQFFILTVFFNYDIFFAVVFLR